MPGVSPQFLSYIQAVTPTMARGAQDWDAFVRVHEQYGVPIEGPRDSGFGANVINFAETAALAYLGGAALGELTAVEGGALSGGEFVDTSLGRPPPIVQDIGRWAAATAATRALGGNRALGKLVGRLVMDDEWGFDSETGDVWGIDSGDIGNVIRDYGGSLPSIFQGGGGAVVQPTMGAFPAAGAMVASLGARLARMFGGRGATFVINGVRGKLADLWPYVRRYGPQAVAGALGVGMAELATLLAQAPTQGRRKRGRGISAADIRRAKRVIRFNRRLSRELGTGRSRGGYRPRRRSYRYC